MFESTFYSWKDIGYSTDIDWYHSGGTQRTKDWMTGRSPVCLEVCTGPGDCRTPTLLSVEALWGQYFYKRQNTKYPVRNNRKTRTPLTWRCDSRYQMSTMDKICLDVDPASSTTVGNSGPLALWLNAQKAFLHCHAGTVAAWHALQFHFLACVKPRG